MCRVTSVALVSVVLLLVTACSSQSEFPLGGIKEVEFCAFEDPGYGPTWMASDAEIARFVDAYLRVGPYRSDVGTTHDARIDVALADGQHLVVWGGGEDFQTVKWQGKQFNIQGEELRDLFEDIAERR